MNISVQTILAWYGKQGRDLPWRKTKDPYKILVSEVMLQQTQVSRGILFYEKWLKQFPDWNALAVAPKEEVIRAWSGLGYNRRALMLQQIAQRVVENGVPQTEEEWKALKGIGPYTAAAVSLFSGQQKAYPVDTNIRRVIARVFLQKPYPTLGDDAEIEQTLRNILKENRDVGDFFQALFDFANDRCLKVPLCQQCPLQMQCRSASLFLSGTVITPKAMIKKAKEKKHRNKPYPDRIFRGRILKLVQEKGRIPLRAVGKNIDTLYEPSLDLIWVQKMVERMVRDGLIQQMGEEIFL